MPIQFDNVSYFTVEEAAYKGGVTPSYVYRMIRKGKLKPKKVGRMVLLSYDQILQWLNNRQRPGRPKKLQGGK